MRLALYHLKGGVGKTASTVNLAYLAARGGARTLIVDLDPQSSSTYYFRIKPKFRSGVKGFVKGGRRIPGNIKATDYEYLDLLPADFSFRHLDQRFDRQKNSREHLARILAPLEKSYDYIFIDCPPSVNVLAENIFAAADYLIVPIIPTTLSARSFSQLMAFFRKRKMSRRKVLAFFSMVEARKIMHRETMASMSGEIRGLLTSHIPYMAEIERMGQRREPVGAFSPDSLANQAYINLWSEIQSVIKRKDHK